MDCFDEKLEDSSFSGGFLIQKLRENCPEFVEIERDFKVSKIKARDISEGSGYLSKVYKCNFSFSAKNGDESETPPEFSIILKEPGIKAVVDAVNDFSSTKEEGDKVCDSMSELIVKMHKNECTVYSHFKNSNLAIPKCFGQGEIGKNPGYLIMEYLADGYFPQFHQGLTEKQAKNVIDFVLDAQVEATRTGDWWKEKLTFINFGNDDDEGSTFMIFDKLQTGRSEEFVRICQRFKKFLTEKKVAKEIMISQFEDLGLPKMLTHGDLWTNNLCFKTDPETGKPTEDLRAIIDWQVASAANPLLDVSRIVCICCDADIRRQLEPTIIDYYIDGFSRRIGRKPEELPFTKKEIEKCKNLADLANLYFFALLSVMHYRKNTEESKRNQQLILKRLEELMTDLLPMMEENFPEYLS